MKKTVGFLCFLLFALSVKAQMTPDEQKKIAEAKARLKAAQADPRIAAKLKQAQHMDSVKATPQFQQQMQMASQKLDSAKKTNPSLANVKMPVINNVNVQTSFQNVNFEGLEARVKNTNQRLQGYMQLIGQAIPKSNAAIHAESLPALTSSTMVALANSELKIARSKLSPTLLNRLGEMVKNPKINLASTGVFLLSTGGSKYAGLYLICSAIIENPKDIWAANDLGVYYRDLSNYQRSLQCYFYANALAGGKSTVINTNIGWAAAYYGDFDTGVKYFDNALAINNNLNRANEGKAMIAYSKGDYNALLACLSKEIKYWVGGGKADDGPSDAFIAAATAAISENNMRHDRDNVDPDSDHTYDNSDADDNGQDPPPGADDDVTYPRYKKIFINDAKDLIWIGKYFYDFGKSARADLIQRSNNLKQTLATLKPLVQAPSGDSQGDLVVPNNFQKFVSMMVPVEDLFQEKVGRYKKDFEGKIKPITMDVFNHDEDMVKEYMKELGACPPDNPAHDRCVAEVNCTWVPKMHKSKNSDLEMISEMWQAYYARVSNAIQWYINATAPFVSRVHDVGWNGYLNADREFIIRRAIVESYGEWGNGLHTIVNGTGVLGVIQMQPPDCPPVEMSVNAPDPFSKKPKHIKEFEGPCYDHTYGGFGAGVEETCHSSKFFIGGGPFKVFYEHMNDPIAAQNNNYTHKIGTDVSVSKDIDVVKFGDKTVVSASAELEGKLEAQFNDNWQLTGGSSSIGASADIGGVNLGGIEASRTMEVVDGQINVSPLQVKTSGPLH
jgi:tetratricopeptide (TPR) repeat protein